MEGIGMTMYDGSGYSDSTRRAAEASSDAASAKRDVAALEDELARLKLACAAMWELLKERAKLGEDDLATRMAMLDAKDGVADGKLTRLARKCVQCGRTIKARQNKCMYCGTVQPIESIFESL